MCIRDRPARPHVAEDPGALEQIAGDQPTAEAISTLAHELRSPLTAIAGYSDLLRRDLVGSLSEEQRSMIGIIGDNAKRMNEQLSSCLLYTSRCV